jgi:hypothetical protein
MGRALGSQSRARAATMTPLRATERLARAHAAGRVPGLVLLVLLVSLVVPFVAALAAGCDRKDDDAAPSLAPSSVVSASEAPAEAVTGARPPPSSPPPSSSASAPPSAASPVDASVAASAPSAPASATLAAVPRGRGADAGPGECGKKPFADCPLQAWMKRETIPAMASNDLPTIGGVLDQMVDLAPPPPVQVGDAAVVGYPNWSSIARDGAAAARAGNIDAVKGACRGCHEQYLVKYRNEHRARPLPPQASLPLP